MARTGRKFYVKDTSKDVHTQFGYVKAKELTGKPGTVLKTNMDKELFLFKPSFIDAYEKISRLAQIIPLKDIGSIITVTGLNNKSIIVDAGTGSGALACFMALHAKKVISYDIRQDHQEVAKRNMEFLGLKNIEFRYQDISGKIYEKDVDIITLDLPEPWEAINSCTKALKPGGFIVSYSPCIPQVQDFVNNVLENKHLIFIKTLEILEREWEVNGRKIRPRTQGIGHSGFLTFIRKLY